MQRSITSNSRSATSFSARFLKGRVGFRGRRRCGNELQRTYIWKKYALQCEDGKLLLDNRNFVKDFPIHDGSVLKMVVKPIIRKQKRQARPNPRKRFFNTNIYR